MNQIRLNVYFSPFKVSSKRLPSNALGGNSSSKKSNEVVFVCSEWTFQYGVQCWGILDQLS
jgi:hypothetical protein